MQTARLSIARVAFTVVRRKARYVLNQNESDNTEKKQVALRVGVRRETYAYWYLRRLGFVSVARNFTPSHAREFRGIHLWCGCTKPCWLRLSTEQPMYP